MRQGPLKGPRRGTAHLACAAAFTLLLCLSTIDSSGCRHPATDRRQSPPLDPATTTEPAYAGSGPLLARVFRLRQRLALRRPLSFYRSGALQRAALARLVRRSTIEISLSALADRLLIELPPSHPAGDLELLLADDTDQLVVFSKSRWRTVLPRAALPDVLDRREPSTRRVSRGARLRPLTCPPVLERPPATKVACYQARVPLEREAAGHTRRLLQTTLTVLMRAGVDPALLPARPYQQPLYQLALPLLAMPSGQAVLEALTERLPAPLAWLASVDDGSGPESANARFHVQVEQLGLHRLSPQRFATRRAGYRDARHLSAPAIAGRRAPALARLARLRRGNKGGMLQVNNRSAGAAFVYIDGLRVGWVAGGRELRFGGLVRGYYRVYAHCPSGMRVWGPRDLYLPGLFVLD